jgi:DNA-binding MarR family transcriptional regulator
LEEEGFIIRTPSPTDKRILQLFPTEKALSLLPEISPILRCWEACLTADLSEEEIRSLEFLLSRMRDKASAWMENH